MPPRDDDQNIDDQNQNEDAANEVAEDAVDVLLRIADRIRNGEQEPEQAQQPAQVRAQFRPPPDLNYDYNPDYGYVVMDEVGNIPAGAVVGMRDGGVVVNWADLANALPEADVRNAYRQVHLDGTPYGTSPLRDVYSSYDGERYLLTSGPQGEYARNLSREIEHLRTVSYRYETENHRLRDVLRSILEWSRKDDEEARRCGFLKADEDGYVTKLIKEVLPVGIYDLQRGQPAPAADPVFDDADPFADND